MLLSGRGGWSAVVLTDALAGLPRVLSVDVARPPSRALSAEDGRDPRFSALLSDPLALSVDEFLGLSVDEFLSLSVELFLRARSVELFLSRSVELCLSLSAEFGRDLSAELGREPLAIARVLCSNRSFSVAFRSNRSRVRRSFSF